MEPQTLTIKGLEEESHDQRTEAKITEQRAEVRVWALPDQVEEFKDDLIIMIKNNPLPVIVPLKCLGQKPVLEVIQGDGL